MDYFYSSRTGQPERGDLLISEPFLPDPNFERTVIFLCEHDDQGSFGFVLNKPSKAVFKDVMDGVDDFSAKLLVGGPVQQNTLHFLHRIPELMDSGKEIRDGIYWGGDFEKLILLINTNQINTKDFRFFLGYSGWSEGQLQEELEIKSWIVYKKVKREKIFDTDLSVLWKIVLGELGGKYEMFSKYPEDPRMN